jgi:ureidoacrylate peracid hydrolase
MIVVGGREILTTLEEKVDPRHCAVIMIDMQKDFTAEGFWWDKLGQLEDDPIKNLPERLRGFLDVARSHGIPIVHVNACYDPQYLNDPMRERMYRLGIDLEACQSGTAGIEPHEGLEPQAGEPVVVKHRYDGFYDTELDMRLRSAAIKSLIVTGVAVHGCVDSTIRHAYFSGYYVVLVDDLTGGANADAHRITVDSVNLMFGITAHSDEVLDAWTRVQPGDERAEILSLG